MLTTIRNLAFVALFSVFVTLNYAQPLSPSEEQEAILRLGQLTSQLTLPEKEIAGSTGGSVRLAAGLGVARERLALLERLAGLRPDEVLRNLLPSAERSRLESLGLPVESVEQVTGVVNVVVHDGFAESPTKYEISYEGGVGPVFGAAEQVGGLACGDTARLQLVVAGEARVLAAADVVTSSPTPGCSPLGEQRVAVILMHRPGSGPPGTDASFWRQRLFGLNALSLSDFVAASSYGRASIAGEVFGWYAASENYACADLSTVRQLALEAAAAEIDFDVYHRVVLIFEARPGESCGAGGYGTIGCQSLATPQGQKQLSFSWLFARNLADTNPSSPVMTTTIHELGHNLGLHHARSLEFSNETLAASAASGTRGEYGDFFSVMGGTGDLSAKHKQFLGWLAGEAEVQTVTSSGVYTLSPLQSDGPLPRALRIRRGLEGDEWLWLEARQRTPWELPAASLSYGDITEGAFVRFEDAAEPASNRYTDRLATDVPRPDPRIIRPRLVAGQPWRDNHGPLRLELVNQTESATEIRVDYIEPCATVALPGSSVAGGGGSFAVSVQALDSCSWNVVSDQSFALHSGPPSYSGPAMVSFVFDPNASANPRNVNLTVGHQVFRITQQGSLDGSIVSRINFLSRDVAFHVPVGFQLTLQDGKGVQNLDKLELRIGTARDQALCAVMVDFSTQQFSLLASNLETPVHTSPLVNPVEGETPYCRFTVLSYRGNLFQQNAGELPISFRMSLTPPLAGVTSGALAFYAKVSGLDGKVTDWQQIRSFSAGSACVPRTAGSRLMLNQSARTVDYRVTAPEGCLWSAAPESSGLAFDTTWRSGSAMLSMDVPPVDHPVDGLPFEVGTYRKELYRFEGAGVAPLVPGPESVVHGASFLQPVATGSWLSIFGTNLALAPGSWVEDDFVDSYLPLGLDGAEVLVNGQPAPISFVSSGQLNVLLPGGVATQEMKLRVRTPFGESDEHLIPGSDVAPGIFAYTVNGLNHAAAHDADFLAIGPIPDDDFSIVIRRPAKPGEVISVYGTGFGETNPPVDEHKLVQRVAPLANPAAAAVTLGGTPCPIEFIGKSGNGLHQMNIRVPDLPAGDHELVLSIGGVQSQPGVHVRIAR